MLVSLPYCTGDFWMGNTKSPMDTSKVPAALLGGEPTNAEDGYHYGYTNARLALDWTMENMGKKTLRSFVLMGSSAGNIGSGTWSNTVLGSFKYTKASVFLDCATDPPRGSAFPQIVQQWDACDNGVFKQKELEPFRDACRNQKFDYRDILLHSIKKYRNVAFAHLQTKE